MSARYTSELANDFGNLASRLTSMVERYCGGALPAPAEEPALAAAVAAAARDADERFCRLDFQGGIEAVMGLVKQVNGYVTEQQPWQLARDDARRADLDRVLYATADCLRAAAVLLDAVLPKACGSLWSALGADSTLGPLSDQRVQDAGAWGVLPAGSRVTKLQPLFPRIEEPAGS